MKQIKRRLKRGEVLKGCWLNLGSSLTAEIVGLAGFDWVLIDMEHGGGSERETLYQLQALEHTPAAAVVRIESSARQRIHRVLDFGAEGIMFPRVADEAEARAAVRGLQYPPQGDRGVAKMVRATGFGKDFAGYYAQSREDLLGVVQVETLEILKHLDAVAALPGVDVLFIGPSDLSMALGCFGETEHPEYRNAIASTINAAERAGKATGILLSNPDDYDSYRAMGIQMIACGADGSFVAEGARNMFQRLNASHHQ